MESVFLDTQVGCGEIGDLLRFMIGDHMIISIFMAVYQGVTCVEDFCNEELILPKIIGADDEF